MTTATHDALDTKFIRTGMDDDGCWEGYDEPYNCGDHIPGTGTALCQKHLDQAKARYPQGWSYYPGDICKHGAYVGGSGIDWMCGPCESGE